MPGIGDRSRGATFPLILVLASCAALGVASAPVAAQTSPPTKISPPYSSGTSLTQSWNNRTTKSGNSYVSPVRANLSNGNTSFDIFANTWGGSRTVVAQVGFSFAIGRVTSGIHHVAASWSLSWKIGGQGRTCSSGCNAHGFVVGTLFLLVEDRTNNSSALSSHRFATGGYPGLLNYTSGTLNTTLFLKMLLVNGHSYQLETFVRASIRVTGSYAGAYASFDMTAPFGGTLNLVSIR